MLHQAGASVVVWQEIFDNGANPPNDTLIDVWKTTDDGEHFKAHGYQGEMAAVTKAGYHAILSAPFYLNIISYGMDWWTYYQVRKQCCVLAYFSDRFAPGIGLSVGPTPPSSPPDGRVWKF